MTRTCRACYRRKPVEDFGLAAAAYRCNTCRSSFDELTKHRELREERWRAGAEALTAPIAAWFAPAATLDRLELEGESFFDSPPPRPALRLVVG